MTFKFLKAGLVSLLISVSGFANADIILFEWESTDGDQSLAWKLDTLRLPDWSDSSRASYNVLYEDFYGDNGVTQGMGDFMVFDEDGLGGVNLSVKLGEVGRKVVLNTFGAQIYTGPNIAPVFTTGYFDLYNDVAMKIMGGRLNINVSTEVPEPTALAILALGLIGLTSRRFKKQS